MLIINNIVQWRNFKFRAPVQENHSGPSPYRHRHIQYTCYWWGLRTEAPLVRRRDRDAESLESKEEGYGEGNLPSRREGWGSVASSLSAAGSGAKPPAENGF